MKSTTYLCCQQLSRDTKRQVTMPDDPFTHPLVTQLVAHTLRSAVVVVTCPGLVVVFGRAG